MSIRNRRNKVSRPTKSERPYNELYESFESIVAPIFEDRVPEGRRADAYVNVPSVEKAIEEYISTQTNQVAILHGLMGAGKSTLLENFYENSKRVDGRVVLYLNFQGRRFRLMPDMDFHKLNDDERRNVTRTAATKRINDLLSGFLGDHIEYVNLNLFDFVKKHYLTEIGRKALFVNTDKEKMELLNDFMADSDQTAPIQCFITFLASINNLKEIVFVVDNVDEQSFDVVEGLFFSLCDTLDCLQRPRRQPLKSSATNVLEEQTDMVSENDEALTKYSAILSCRDHTFEILQNDPQGILPTRGCVEIEVSTDSLLSEIINKRLDFVTKNGTPGRKELTAAQDSPYVLRSGMSVNVGDPFTFIRSFVKKISVSSVESKLFDMFNRNHAKALKNLKYILQNRYFISYDADVLKRGEIKPDFQFSRVLNALGYGNPSTPEGLYFPARSTVLTNLLYWQPTNEDSFFATLRVLKWIEKNVAPAGFGAISNEGCAVIDVIRNFKADYGMDETVCSTAVQYCHNNGLLFSESGHSAKLHGNERVCVSPKGEMLLEQVFLDSVLVEMFIDDIPVPSERSVILENRPHTVCLGKYPTRRHFDDLLNWLMFFLDMERSFLERARAENSVFSQNSISLFDGQMISGHIGKALEHTYEHYYKPVCKQSDKASLNDFNKLCNDSARYFGG